MDYFTAFIRACMALILSISVILGRNNVDIRQKEDMRSVMNYSFMKL